MFVGSLVVVTAVNVSIIVLIFRRWSGRLWVPFVLVSVGTLLALFEMAVLLDLVGPLSRGARTAGTVVLVAPPLAATAHAAVRAGKTLRHMREADNE